MSIRYNAQALKKFASTLFASTGIASDRADIMAEVFLEADLMGFTTHGLNRVASNLHWLQSGASRLAGEPHVLLDRGNCLNWDAEFLPGPWVVSQAVDEALARVKQYGVVSIVIRRSQHIACLAAYLPKILERNCVGLLTCSTPAERTVAPQGSKTPLFSANPIAFGAPAGDYPLLFDISMSATAGGYVARAEREGKKLPHAYLKDSAGNPSDDPAAFANGGSILPVGGMDHGYKGAALSAMLEVLSMGLGGYGRADEVAQDDEANSVFIQVIDPQAFGDSQHFLRQTSALTALWSSCEADGNGEIRVPGKRAWGLRREQLQLGVSLYPLIEQDLKVLAQTYDITFPSPAG
ncbi:Ldh family oxidoreductase [Microbulbifer agarilyticus]|uniref:Ldh family oxidoreductase n=1 Tax=Microbulbifer agarilyticus TaxID=260552 RepID=UPI001C975351|nr:Ldh family oxidoreductase [Microbulbifer agarilyticus]MBY6190612.1 Ldh family oxidoreductase [Microbulbifer agarilyticus]